jgi:hypothetical protein
MIGLGLKCSGKVNWIDWQDSKKFVQFLLNLKTLNGANEIISALDMN